MNSIHRRLVSLLLVFVLIFSAIPTSVFATDTDRENENLDKDILLNEQAGQADNFEENSDEIDSLLQDTENTTSNISAYSMIPVESISVNEDSLTIEAGGDTASLEAKVLPEDATNRNIVWTSSAPEIATVSDEGTVTPVSEGTADIIATADGVSTKCVVTVLSAGVTVTGITLDKNTLEMTAGGETAALVATVLPEDATSKDVTWTSSAPTIATVANGIVTPVSEGSAIITATAGDFSAECTVTVAAAKVAVTGVALDQHELTLNVKETGTLKATLAPENATNKALTWSSSAEAVATVEDGVVTAVAMGTTTITVATEDGGFTDSCTVTVEKEETEISLLDFSFRIWGSKADGYIGSESLKIVADGNDEYHLIAPTYAVFPAGTAKLLISAPEDLKEEYTVTYTSWNNQDSEYCYGEKN